MKKSKKNFIQDAIKHPGALRKTLGIKEGQTIPVEKLKELSKGNDLTAKRARLALTLRKLNKKIKK